MHTIILSLLGLAAAVSLFILLVFIIITVYLFHVHHKFAHIPGPPLDSFYFGNLAKIRALHKSGELSHYLLLQWAQEYGPVFKFFVLHKCMIVLCDQEVVKEVLTKSEYKKSEAVYSKLFSVCGARFLGKGLVTSTDHQKWAKRRALLDPAFHKRLLKKVMVQFNKVGDQWCDILEPLGDGKTTFNVYDYICRVTLDAIGQIGFNYSFGALTDENSPIPQALWKILEGISAQMKDPFIKLRPSKKQFVQEVKHAAALIRTEGHQIIERTSQSTAGTPKSPETILDHITSAQNDPDITMEDHLDDFCSLMIAGQETTANMLAFLLKELGRNPDVKQRLMEEIDNVIGSQKSVNYDDIAKLEYMGQVIKETLRLYPPAMGTARESNDNTVLHGYRIPPGTQLAVSFFILHHMPKYFEDPEAFKPERFSSDIPRKLFTFMPFSLGQRSCAGKHFAMIEAKVLLCKFLRKFDFELDLDQPFAIQETTTLRPKGGVRLILSPRNMTENIQ